MLGVFKKRWKPKRVTSDSIRPVVPESASPEPPPECYARHLPLRQNVYPLPTIGNPDKNSNTFQMCDATWRKTNKSLEEEDEISKGANHAKSEVSNQYEYYGTNRSDYSYDYYGNRGAYPMTPNICVEGGRIEFVKPSLDGMMGIGTPPASPMGARSIRRNISSEEEKYDGDKETLEARIRHLEERLEAESLSAQKDRLAVARLQQQLSKRSSGVPRDAERVRTESGGRAARSDQDADRARLRAAQKEIARMEETIRTLLQYKSKVETLKQENASLSATLEARTIHYQTTLAKLTAENESLRSQVATLQTFNKQIQEQDLKTSDTKQDLAKDLESEKESESHKKQYEKCLDDVANQVVRALLSQKGLREELSRLSTRARELEAQNRTLGALLLRQLRPKPAPSPASPDPTLDLPIDGADCCDGENEPLPLSQKNKFRTQLLSRKCLHKNNRLYKSNEDLNSSNDRHCANDNKRLSDGNIITASCSDRLFSSNSIVSFKDEPVNDVMSLCVHHTYQLSADDKRRHQILSELWTELKGIEVTPQSLLQALRAVDPALWASPKRPLTLNLKVAQPAMLSECLHRLSQTIPEDLPPQTTEDEVTVESPESGNRDEGYSTMSSDVQVDPCRQGETSRELEDLKEASDETDNQVIVNINNAILVEDKSDQEILYIPLNLAVSFNPRNSYPPTKNLNPFQHIMRSFSDSNLCLKFTTSASQCGENYVTFSSPSSPMILLDIMPVVPRDKKNLPLRRTKGASNLVSTSTVNDNADTSHSRSSWVSNIDEQVDNCQYDAEYVQHWLQLDDTRSALQQQHRDLLDLEYDQAEMEDWSLNLSCEDLQDPQWKKSQTDAVTPGQISIATLPSIQENNALELEEDVSDCLWNNSSYLMDNSSDRYAHLSMDHDMEADTKDENHWPYPPMENSGLPSPGGSWSSIDNSEECCVNNDCYYNNEHTEDNDLSKRSSCYTDEPESSTIGIDFTRDFYRLVKFESTKSLASNSSRGLGAGGGQECNGPILKLPDVQITLKQEREQALQNVLNFIAEQQKYCHNREEQDSLPSRPISEIRELPPPYIDCQEFNVDETGSVNNESTNIDENYRNSYGSDLIYSENGSCDIVLSNDYNSLYSDISPDLSKIPRIIDNQNSDYSEPEGFRDYNELENEIDEQHLLKVHQKNEINKSIDVSISVNSEDFGMTSTPQDVSKVVDPKQDMSSQTESLELQEDPQQHVANNDVPAVNTSEPSLLDEILNACKCPNGPLVPVPEEEETAMENSLTQTSDSMTTSVSTSDTVATEICKSKKKTDKSKIPLPSTSMLKKSQIPIKAKSKLPLPNSPKKSLVVSVSGQCPAPSTSKVSPGSIIVTHGPSHSRMVSFHEAATSKDVIEELNRMIRKGEDGGVTSDNEGPAVHTSNMDKALWCPTGWVHVEREIDFSDPKARANLLDVMLASSDSSPSPTSSCAGSYSSDSGDERIADYSKLHKLHRYRRQKKAAALRERGLAVLRFSCLHRPTIIGRNDFFFRYGKQEREAVACFDFLEDMSASMNFLTSIEESNTISCVENQISQDSGKVSQKSTDTFKNKEDSDHSSHETFSDSCALSYSGSDMSFEDNHL